MEELRTVYGVTTAETQADKERMIAESDVVVLSMKPKDAAEALRAAAPLLHEGQLVISLIAGLSISTIHTILGKQIPLVSHDAQHLQLHRAWLTGLSFSEQVNEEQRCAAQQLFRSIGGIAIVEEPLLEAVTGLSGSGPAYIYYIMEAMINAGQQMGLDADTSRELTVQTVLGAAEMMRVTGEQPAELRRKVTSPNGATQAAIELMQTHGVAQHFKEGMLRSAERAAEMGREIERSVHHE